MNKHKPGFYEKYTKRVIDIILSGSALLLLSPVMAVTALLVRIKLGSPVLFSQERPGKDERIFRLFKFRTMLNTMRDGVLLSDEERLTPFGRRLRALSIDELPELWNVLKGDMSIVGPRPLLVKYLPLYSEEQHRRHDVRPGITGWAQVNGRNLLSWEDRFVCDVYYVDNISFAFDVKVMLRTLSVVFKRSGITSGTSATMEEFRGSVVCDGRSAGRQGEPT